MKRLLIVLVLVYSTFFSSALSEIKVGIVLGFTGPIESLTPLMADSAELALEEASNSEVFLNGKKITPIRADSTCNDVDTAIKAAEDVIAQGVIALIGAVCLEETKSILLESALPNEIVMISPAATSPALTNLENKGFFFRTTASESRGGEILADITKDNKIKKIAITYANNDYGKTLANVYKKAIEEYGIKVTISVPYEYGKTDFSSEVATFVSAGGDAIAILGSFENGGKEIIQASLDSGAFDRFILSDRMINKSLMNTFGKKLKKSTGYISGSIGKGANYFHKVAEAGGIDSSAPYVGESYDAAALIVLAMQAGQSSDKKTIANNIMNIANSPGIKIYPGELKKGIELLKKGKEIDYEGASRVNFTTNGETKGSFLELKFKGKKFISNKQR